MATPEDLAHRHAHHPPRDQATITAHETIRAAAHEFARTVNAYAPDSREKTLSLTRAEEAMMWANAAIARHPEGEDATYDNGGYLTPGAQTFTNTTGHSIPVHTPGKDTE